MYVVYIWKSVLFMLFWCSTFHNHFPHASFVLFLRLIKLHLSCMGNLSDSLGNWEVQPLWWSFLRLNKCIFFAFYVVVRSLFVRSRSNSDLQLNHGQNSPKRVSHEADNFVWIDVEFEMSLSQFLDVAGFTDNLDAVKSFKLIKTFYLVQHTWYTW